MRPNLHQMVQIDNVQVLGLAPADADFYTTFLVGFGTWQAKPGEVERAVETALKAGYRHIDCAATYRNEVEVGDGIRRSGVPRSEIFITGKLWNTKHAPQDAEAALDKSLQDLGVEYLDLFLMHWPE